MIASSAKSSCRLEVRPSLGVEFAGVPGRQKSGPRRVLETGSSAKMGESGCEESTPDERRCTPIHCLARGILPLAE